MMVVVVVEGPGKPGPSVVGHDEGFCLVDWFREPVSFSDNNHMCLLIGFIRFERNQDNQELDLLGCGPCEWGSTSHAYP